MGNLEKHAERELRLAGLFDEDSDYGGMLAEAVLDMIRLFAEEGHSGASAAMTINLFSRVARFEPLTPLTGEESEWMDVTEWCPGSGVVHQNIRCSRVFRDDDGAYDSDRNCANPDPAWFI